MPRPILPANDAAAHAAWIAEAVAAAFHTPRLLPILRRRAEPELPLPDLFRDLLDGQTGPAEIDVPASVMERSAPVQATEASLKLTFDMGRFQDAHMSDRCEPGERGYTVTCPPFHLHDEEHMDPADEFLGQVVNVEAGRALLFRRRDPCVMDGCEVGQRYVLIRFWDDEEGQVWSMPVEGEEDAAVMESIDTTTGLYRGWRRKAA